MITTFYSKDFVPLQNNASLNVGKFQLTRRAVDFDDFSLTSEAFVENVNPCFVVMKNDIGNYIYGAFAGIPTLNKESQTELQASDLKTLFNNEILMEFETYTHLDTMLSAMFEKFNLQVLQGSFSIEVDMTDISSIALGELKPETKLKVYNVWSDILSPYLKYYNCYMMSKIDIPNKKIKYSIKRTNLFTIPLKLFELGIKDYGKWIASLNEAQAIISVNGTLTYGTKFILLSDSSITSDTSLRDIYPIKRSIIFKETNSSDELVELLNDGNIEALTTIAENRFNESIEFSSNNIKHFENADFDTSFDVYVEKGQLYKTLPLGEIKISSENVKTLVVGYKNNDIINYI